MLPHSGILVFVSSGIPLPSSSELHPLHGTSGVTTSLCQHPLRHYSIRSLVSGPCPICSDLLLGSTPGSLPSGPFSVPRPCVCCVGEAILLPLIHARYFEIPWNCWIFYYRHDFLTSKKKKKSAMWLMFHCLALKVLFKVNHLELCRMSWRSNYFLVSLCVKRPSHMLSFCRNRF